MRVPIDYPAWSSDMSVLVKGSAEAVSAVDLQVADVSWRADRLGYRAERSGVLQRSVRSMLVVQGLELAERVAQERRGVGRSEIGDRPSAVARQIMMPPMPCACDHIGGERRGRPRPAIKTVTWADELSAPAGPAVAGGA